MERGVPNTGLCLRTNRYLQACLEASLRNVSFPPCKKADLFPKPVISLSRSLPPGVRKRHATAVPGENVPGEGAFTRMLPRTGTSRIGAAREATRANSTDTDADPWVGSAAGES